MLRSKRFLFGLVLFCSCLSMRASGQPTRQIPESQWFDFKPGGLKAAPGGYALTYGVRNNSRNPEWAMAEFDSPDGTRLCHFVKKLEGHAAFEFACPIANVTVGKDYQLTMSLYEDDKLTDRMARFEPVMAFADADIAAADKARPANGDGAGPLATVLDEGAPTPFPATFKPTWYRRLDRGFSLRAYEHSGDLTISKDALLFVDGKNKITIPVSRIISVRHGIIPRDIANHWVTVKFTNDEQKEDTVCFRDGSRMGMGQDTRLIYLAAWRATRK